MSSRPSVAWGARSASGLSGLTLSDLAMRMMNELVDRVWQEWPRVPDSIRGSHRKEDSCFRGQNVRKG